MDLGLEGKTAVIVGGSKGIGFAAAKEFLSAGANVALCARNGEELRQAQKTLSEYGAVFTQVVDAARGEDIYSFAEKVYERFGAIDCWVNNVGVSDRKSGDEYTEEEIDFVIRTCFTSAVYGCQAAFRYMKHCGGAIINVSSLAARCPSVGSSTIYGPMKAAIVSLTTTFAGEYAAYGIRVVSVLPGFTLTESMRAGFKEEVLKERLDRCLLRRAAEPEEIARPVVFLASPAASYITATSLEVSGGCNTTLNPDFSYKRIAKRH